MAEDKKECDIEETSMSISIYASPNVVVTVFSLPIVTNLSLFSFKISDREIYETSGSALLLL